eukprot:scaffold92951_cov24-Tisochrysis_lutea.AAC.1
MAVLTLLDSASSKDNCGCCGAVSPDPWASSLPLFTPTVSLAGTSAQSPPMDGGWPCLGWLDWATEPTLRKAG